MGFTEELKSIRQHSFLSQEAFARELDVSFSSVNRWESGRSKPNMTAMKRIKSFCKTHSINFSDLESKWFELRSKGAAQ